VIRRKLSLSDSEDGFAVRRRKKSDIELDITPMIDVTFLLLIFFMVTSTMQSKKDLDVPPAEYSVNVEKVSSTIILIKAVDPAGSVRPVIRLDGSDAEITIEQMKLAIEKALLENRSHVIIKADGNVPTGTVMDVGRAISSIEGATMSIGVRERRGN